MTFYFKAIRPRTSIPYVEEIMAAAMKVQQEEGDIAKRMLEKTVETWVEKPRFEKKLTVDGTRWEVRVTTNNAVWRYLNFGTKIRWAIMSRGYRPKSSYRTLGSGSGSGWVVVAGKRYMQAHNIPPRPGIPAMEWTTEVQIRRRPLYARKMNDAIRDACKRAHARAGTKEG